METEHKISYYENGNKKNEGFLINGKCHKENGPSFISYYETGELAGHTYCKNGIYHREDGPAIIKYLPNSKICRTDFRINGIKHNKNGPSVIDFMEDIEEYWINGKLHREDGPAITKHKNIQYIKEETYYLYGKELHKEQYDFVLQFPIEDCQNVIEVHFGLSIA